MNSIKITKENYEKLLDLWILDPKSRSASLVYFSSHMNFSLMAEYAFNHNIIIEDIEISGPFRKIKFIGGIIEI
jgi:hypothetical protein